MPPWSNRLLSPSTGAEAGSSSNSNNANADSPARARSRITESDILENAYGIPSLPPNPQTYYGASSTAKPARTPSHGRSMSHPFPSLFAGRKKTIEEGPSAGGYESTDDDVVSPAQPRKAGHGSVTKQKVPDKDLRTGNCMTCDCMVRWPKELKVFRCTVCLTINDLKPIVLEARRSDGQRVPVTGKAGTYPGSCFPPKVVPLSVDKTRQIIDTCINAFLAECLRHDDSPTSSPGNSPPQSPSYETRSQERALDHGTSPMSQSPNLLPLRLPKRPITKVDQISDIKKDFLVPADLRDRGASPYSRSSPGDFFAAHMEQRGRNRDVSRPEPLGFRAPGSTSQNTEEQRKVNAIRKIFKPLEEYIITAFGSYECVNASFSTIRPSMAPRAASEGSKHTPSRPSVERQARAEMAMSEMDAKTLLIGDFAENGFWWTGERSDAKRSEESRTYRGAVTRETTDSVTLKTPRIDWNELNEWYYVVINAGRLWRRKLDDVATSSDRLSRGHLPDHLLEEIEDQILEAQSHVQRVLLKVTESLLKRPGRPLTEPADLRTLLIILANPLLYSSRSNLRKDERSTSRSRSRSISREVKATIVNSNSSRSKNNGRDLSLGVSNIRKGSSGQHSGIIKRVLGLLSNVPNDCHHHLVSWFARYSDGQFQRIADLIGSFVTYRLTRQRGKKRDIEHDPTAGLIPSMGGPRGGTSAALHDALGSSGQPRSSKKMDGKQQKVIYNDDWQIKAAARVMALVFSANNSGLTKRGDTRPSANLQFGHSAGLAARERAHRHGQILATSDFYNTLLDYSDLIADFEAWESRRGKFAFCQYPFFLSIWAKIQIMEHDARRQMEVKAREAFFDSIMTRKTINQYLVLKVRRDCLVEDSLKGVSEVVGTGSEEIKKGLKIEFKGEEGIDAGGLRKEWFLLLVREVFNPEHGMFTYDEDSQFCYFNPNSLETTDQFFLVGVVLGLAIYNSTILDVAFPPFAFRKLMAAAPATAPGAASHAKPSMTYSLEDLAEFRPSLAGGLRQLLDFDGDVEATFCRDFVADVDRFGENSQVPLCAHGEKRAVTNSNRREFVDLYVRYLLDIAVVRQFEPFKRGFFTVCGGNALSLFRPEEIELLIRGSEEPLDISSLRAVSKCENWGVPNPSETELAVSWFWQSFQSAGPADQRKLLSFITGSDRIPAMGATNLVIKLSCLGNDSMRFPVARTCFNQLSLWRYSSKQKLENLLWRAVYESEGFGLK